MQQLWLLVVTPMRALVRVEGTNSGPDFLAPQNGANTKTNFFANHLMLLLLPSLALSLQQLNKKRQHEHELD